MTNFLHLLCYIMIKNIERNVTMKIKQINPKDKIRIEQERMEHEETRFRLKYSDESGVSITTNANYAYWQNAHYHKFGHELYAIQKGKVILALQEEKRINYRILENSDSIILKQGVKHNLFLFPNTVMYNVKFGNVLPNDWNEAKWLNEQCRKVKIEHILNQQIKKVI